MVTGKALPAKSKSGTLAVLFTGLLLAAPVVDADTVGWWRFGVNKFGIVIIFK